VPSAPTADSDSRSRIRDSPTSASLAMKLRPRRTCEARDPDSVGHPGSQNGLGFVCLAARSSAAAAAGGAPTRHSASADGYQEFGCWDPRFPATGAQCQKRNPRVRKPSPRVVPVHDATVSVCLSVCMYVVPVHTTRGTCLGEALRVEL
jgi:hypothetical protein